MTLQTSINANTFFPLGQIFGGTGVNTPTTTPTAAAYAAWNANSNLAFNNYLGGYTTTITTAGTTILTVASSLQQFFTGSTTHTVQMPVTSTLVLGMMWRIVNLSSGNVTVNSSGGNLIVTLPPNSETSITCILTSGTTAASWQFNYDVNNGGVTSLTGTINQVNVSAATGNVLLSLPQSIATVSSPTFAALTLTNPHIAGSGGLVSFQTFTTGTAATYTRPAGITSIYVEVLGGGGGGGSSAGAPASVSVAGGGSAGGYAALWIPSAAASYTYTVGTGGPGATGGNNSGGPGGTTTFSASSLQATGGNGGQGMPSVQVAQSNKTFPVVGGIGSNGNINVQGAPALGSIAALGSTFGSAGASSHYGGGGITTTIPSVGGNAGNYGSGGAGGTSTTANSAGGNGSAGLIRVWEFA